MAPTQTSDVKVTWESGLMALSDLRVGLKAWVEKVSPGKTRDMILFAAAIVIIKMLACLADA